MARRRLGVALLLPPIVAGEVDVLRRAVGADDIDRLPPHLTLVPPVNVREDDLDDAVGRLRDAADQVRPFRLTLGPPATFLPINPVLYLQVGGDVASVDKLRDRVFRPPLERPLTWPFQPHVTVLDGGDPERIRAAVDALAGWTAEVVLDRIDLLEELRRDDGARAWRSIAEVPLGGPAVIGRGGLELELAVTAHLSPQEAAFRDRSFDEHSAARFGEAPKPEPLAVAARRDGRLVGTADGEVRSTGEAYLRNLIVAADVRREGVGAQLLAAFSSAVAERGATYVTLLTDADGPAVGFYERLDYERSYLLPEWRGGRDFVQLRRNL